MAISTNSIIHYTKNIKYLSRILDEGFKVKYCYEKISSSESGFLHAAFPMVCFCDIPLSQVGQHLESYGYYGIGLTKEWAKRNKLNPVLYFDKDSELINFLRKDFEQKILKFKNNENQEEDFIDLLRIFSYSKNYEGSAPIKGIVKNNKNYRFANEKEWRYVPNSETLGSNRAWVPNDSYAMNKSNFNNALSNIRLKFEPKEISYIIVKTDEEIQAISSVIRNTFSQRCTLQEMEKLLSRIMTSEQIMNDF